VEAPIYHITTAAEAEAARKSGVYEPPSFNLDGFIHCSYRHQLGGVAARWFPGRHGLVVLEIDRGKLPCAVLDENLQGGSERFPHIYGRLPLTAVVAVHQFPMALS
jgi:uncharacterized protein (DUF952 family)